MAAKLEDETYMDIYEHGYCSFLGNKGGSV
jgi:hypothetical protein